MALESRWVSMLLYRSALAWLSPYRLASVSMLPYRSALAWLSPYRSVSAWLSPWKYELALGWQWWLAYRAWVAFVLVRESACL